MRVLKGMLSVVVGLGLTVGVQCATASLAGILPGACKPVETVAPPPQACTPVVQLPPVKACEAVKACEPVKTCEPVRTYQPIHPLHKLEQVKRHIEAHVRSEIEKIHARHSYVAEGGCGCGVETSAPATASPAAPALAPAPANLPAPPTPNKG